MFGAIKLIGAFWGPIAALVLIGIFVAAIMYRRG